ncbi:hypothetical protein N7466_005813 [Penicillium verhagenii]|uniref:uncharacterized protein n=1 Tax=Penicillium verhagenii TaxID=1562060 RepID=UPI0025457E6A|nr:uncharacterized protein N7466_005813 [Penicillium verhagenii]KAJ5930320.1 hypothetical protein N7466_005813 [Penicillium verhagenii]
MSAFTIDSDTTGVDDVPFSTRTDNNWDNVTAVTRIDQSSGLPAIKITLNPLKNPLQKPEDYDSWKRINSNNSEKWFNASKAIGEWLIANISTEIHSKIQARSTLTLSFADVIWKGIYEEMRGCGIYEDMKQIGAFVNLKRTDFPTKTAFIDDYCARYMRLKEREMEVKPYFAMMTILLQIHQLDVRDSVLQSIKEKNHTAQTFTYNVFCQYTQDLRGRVLIREEDEPFI